MTDQTGVEWPRCGEDGCTGFQLARGGKCLAHATTRRRNATLRQFAETGTIDARGVPITEALLEQILTAAPHDAEDHPTFLATGFDRATFQGPAGFDGATFQGPAGFRGATFQGAASFRGATFQHTAWFDGAIFQGAAWFDGATFRRDAQFGYARFEQALQFGLLLVYGVLRLDAASFVQLIHIEASARGLSCQRTHFAAGVQFRLCGTQIVLDDADLSSPSILMGIAALSNPRLARLEQQLVQAVRRLAPQAAAELSERPRLLSLQGANVAGLGLCGVDLADCRFGGAHNLDKLRVEADVSFAIAPVRLGWEVRQVIAEERALRAQCSGRWTKPMWPAWAEDKPAVLEAGQIAELYRALRKAARTPRTSPAQPTSTTARWRCAATPAAVTPPTALACRPVDGWSAVS
jgi:uncharacterized protein YjbI with pentapeptide repeats